jgi:NitT/TauT family transport system permease protein
VNPPEAAVPAATRPPLWRRPAACAAARRLLIVGMLVALWAAAAAVVQKPALFPTPAATAAAWWQAMTHGDLLDRIGLSLKLLLIGYAVGVVLAMLLAGFGAFTRFGADVMSVLAAVFTPLPGIALLPLALLWFGLGAPSMVFVLAHSVMWPLALSAHAGFGAVPETLRLCGRNYGLRGVRLLALILLPAALPAILTGLRIGWAFAWRTLIAAELVFGVSSGAGGLGWFILLARNQFETPTVFAGLATVTAIGFLMESLVFRGVELLTVRRWGMQR